jgi:hypothetical protein
VDDKAITGDPKYYFHIAVVLFTSFIGSAIALLLLNAESVQAWLNAFLGHGRAFFPQLYFWGCAGATIKCSVFLANDKDLNEREATKPATEKRDIMYPDPIDVLLYAQRIISSGFLAIFAALIVTTGLSYFEVPIVHASGKRQIFFIVMSVLVGLFEAKFLTSLDKLSRRLFTHT